MIARGRYRVAWARGRGFHPPSRGDPVEEPLLDRVVVQRPVDIDRPNASEVGANALQVGLHVQLSLVPALRVGLIDLEVGHEVALLVHAGYSAAAKVRKEERRKKNCWFFFTHPALEHKMYWSRFGRDESTGRMSSFSLALMSYTTSKLSFLSLDSTAPESFLSQAMWRTALE